VRLHLLIGFLLVILTLGYCINVFQSLPGPMVLSKTHLMRTLAMYNDYYWLTTVSYKQIARFLLFYLGHCHLYISWYPTKNQTPR